MSQRTAVVVGAGITGLVAARTLAASGLEVTVLERSERCGGQVHTVEVAGHPVDVGAEALHLAGPHVNQLLNELGLQDQLVTSKTGWTWIWTDRGLRRLPAGVGPAGPTRLAPLVRSGVLGPGGLLRAACEPLVPGRSVDRDMSVGDLLGHRFGRQVTERLVDPLLGSLHAGDVSRLSLQAATPYLAAAIKGRRSLLLGGRGQSGPAPAFTSFPRGLVTLVDALTADPAVAVRTGTVVESVSVDGSGVHIDLADGEVVSSDVLVLAVPAHVAAGLLASGTPERGKEEPEGDRTEGSERAASGLSRMRSASVVTVVASFPRAVIDDTPAFDATGMLVPSTAGRFLKAATFLSRKWAHLDDPDTFLIRMSAGRAGDSEDVTTLPDTVLVERLHADLADATGLRAEPTAIHVQRWPRAMAQLEVGHLDRLGAIRSSLPGSGSVVLAGAPYEGVGLASCIRSGRTAAGQLVEMTRSKMGVAT